MFYGTLKTIAPLMFICAIAPVTLSYALCSVDEVIVSGRVDHAPVESSIRVQLIYSNQKAGDSAELTLDRGSFRIEIPFLTQSRAPLLIGTFREKCDRKPETVVVSLVEGDQELDRVSLDLAKDFKKASSTAYTLRSEILLHGPSS
jgi:hypothetical protein